MTALISSDMYANGNMKSVRFWTLAPLSGEAFRVGVEQACNTPSLPLLYWPPLLPDTQGAM